MKYKLTDQDGYTRKGYSNQTLWEVGKTIEAKGKGNGLCSDGVIHYYKSPYLAMIMNPAHANIKNPRMFIVKGKRVAGDGRKYGAKSLTVIQEIKPPTVTARICATFTILVALKLSNSDVFIREANEWLLTKTKYSDAVWESVRSWAAIKTDYDYNKKLNIDFNALAKKAFELCEDKS